MVHTKRPCAVCDVGGKFQPRKHNGSCDRGWCASPSEKGKPEALLINGAHLVIPGSKHRRQTAEAGILLTPSLPPILRESNKSCSGLTRSSPPSAPPSDSLFSSGFVRGRTGRAGPA